MKAKDIRDKFFKDFIEWMNLNNIDPERFGMDHWMFLALNVLYNQFLDAQERTMQNSKLLHGMPEEILKMALDQKVSARKAAEDKEKKENDAAKKDIEKTRKEAIESRGAGLDKDDGKKIGPAKDGGEVVPNEKKKPPAPDNKKPGEKVADITDIDKGKKD